MELITVLHGRSAVGALQRSCLRVGRHRRDLKIATVGSVRGAAAARFLTL
jgi:hypothetical protein